MCLAKANNPDDLAKRIVNAQRGMFDDDDGDPRRSDAEAPFETDGATRGNLSSALSRRRGTLDWHRLVTP